MKTNFLVAYDFTKASEIALENAIITADKTNSDVHVVHIIESNKDIEKVEKKLKKIPNFNNPRVVTHVRIGNIFEDIVNFSVELHSEFVFLGAHNISVWKKFVTGGDIFRIINTEDKHAPFIINQETPTKPFNKILVPIDNSQTSKQKLSAVYRIAKSFDSEVVILVNNSSHEIKASLRFINKFFNERRIKYSIELRQGDLKDLTIEVCDELKCDLISIVNSTADTFLPKYFTQEQDLILNKLEVPVLVVNPIRKLSSYWS